ncbi:hypothetical protein M405DRAFT_810344 [Rhizopogon salebrosus TDB-379]|nr:hypothetical protein M405DRAFT_810344 [Rhizopogon salebrosus TDB-379]
MPRSEVMSPCATFLSELPLLTLEELGARGTHRFLAESQSSPSRSTPLAPVLRMMSDVSLRGARRVRVFPEVGEGG